MKCIMRGRFSTLRISSIIPFLILFSADGLSTRMPSAQSFASSAADNTQKAAPLPGKVSGHVRRADTGASIAKAEVALIPANAHFDLAEDHRLFTLTDSDGAYVFNKVGPGTYAVVANHAGFVSVSIYSDQAFDSAETFDVGSAETVDKIDVRLVPAGVISGTVSDEDGQPMATVMVEAMRLGYARGGRRMETSQLRVFTDDLGNFRLYGLPQGNYFVRAEATNVSMQTGKLASRLAYYPGTADVENAQPLRITPGNEASGIRLSVGPLSVYSITGNIIESTGLAGQGRYRVMAMDVADLANGGRFTAVVSGAGGSFTLGGLPTGNYAISANLLEQGSNKVSERNVSGHATVRVTENDAHTNIVVSPLTDVGGRVLIENSAGQSLSGKTMLLWPQIDYSYAGPNRLNAMTDQRGNFKITYVASGSYDFSMAPVAGIYLKQITCNGKDHTLTPLGIEGGLRVNDCVITLGTDAGVVKGQVLDGDKPVPGRVVVAIPEDRALRHHERFTVTGNTNTNGEFQLSGVIPGDYLLFAVAPDDDHSYFDIDFADRNQRDGERVGVKAGDAKTVTLKPTSPQ